MQAQHPELDPRTMRLMDEIRMVSHLLYQISESSVAQAELSYAQYRILMMLYFNERLNLDQGDYEGLNPSTISQNMGTSRNTISSLIRTLEDDGLIERQLDPNDRRKFNITITDRGRQLVTDHIGRHMQTVDVVFRTLDPAEMEQLSSLLHKLNDRAQEYRQQCAAAETGGNNAAHN